MRLESTTGIANMDAQRARRVDAGANSHHSTFRLSHEPMHEPMERMLAAAGRSQDRIIVREVGGQWSLN